jgi:hypothetical protein
LSNYLQQFPHPADFGVAQDIEKKIEMLLSNDLAKETLTQTSTTVTSWGEMIHPSAGTNWSPELIQQFTQDVSQVSWKKAKQLIDQLESL